MSAVLNSRTATKAAIRRGTLRAQRDMRTLDRDALAALERQYRAAAADIQRTIESRAAQDGNLKLASLRDLLDQIIARLAQLTEARNSLIGHSIDAAALLGVRPFEGQVSVGSSLTRIAHDAAQFARSFTAEDGLQLSDRLWRLDKGAREAVSDAVQQAIIKGYGASQAAQDFLRRGNPIPSELVREINGANAGAVASAAGKALMTDEGSAYANARRVMRTEINRAHGEAYFKSAEGHPDVAGFRYVLSPAHPRPDICDMHAGVNLYGLGPGVYPDRARCPWPAHPNILSFVEVVFKDEITEADRKGRDASRLAWLQQQPLHRQVAVLGGASKQAAFAAGVLRENEIATPWRVLKAKYEKKGVDITQFKPVSAEPGPSILPAPPPAPTVTNNASPVSAALDVQYNKDVAKRTLEAIDRVHGDGALPIIPLKRAPAGATYEGAYYRSHDDQALRITLRAGGDHPEMTLAHEIGHFLDHKGTPGPGFASEKAKLFADWRDAVRSTDAFRQLNELASGPMVRRIGSDIVQLNKPYLDYLLSWAELWARSYAQWIALRSGDEVMQQQLERTWARQRSALLDLPRQWYAEDFDQVARSIDDIMRRMGWV